MNFIYSAIVGIVVYFVTWLMTRDVPASILGFWIGYFGELITLLLRKPK